MRSHFVPPLLAASLIACGGGASPTSVTPGPTPLPMTTPAPSPTPTPGDAITVLRTARMRGANGHNASGSLRIVRSASGFALEFLADFRIDGGSNDIYLSRSASLDRTRDLRVAELRSRAGAQSYTLPHEGMGYRFVILWCRPFQIPIGIGELQ